MSDYEVGRGKPPLDTRFKRGNQEWRKRKDKRVTNATFSPGDDIKAILAAPIKVQQNGRTRTEVRLRGIVKKLVAEAMRGNVIAANDLLSFRLNAAEIGDMNDTLILMDAPGDDEGDLVP